MDYSPVSIISYGFGTLCALAMENNPVIAVSAATASGFGDAVNAIIGGLDVSTDMKDMKEQLKEAINDAWNTIDRKYKIKKHSEKCLAELKQEIMGERTSVDEFIRNNENKNVESSIAMVIQNILNKYKDELNENNSITWDEKYIQRAAADISSMLVAAMNGVIESGDHLKILTQIVSGQEEIRKKIDSKGDQIIDVIRNSQPSSTYIPPAINMIPAPINLIGRNKDIENIYDLLLK